MLDLDKLSKNYKIFVDTCSFMHNSSSVFFKHLTVHLVQNKTKIFVPYKVVQELEKHQNSDNKLMKKAAIIGISIIQEYKQAQLVDIRGEENDSFADNLFQTVFTKFRIDHNLCLITQDRGLSEDISQLKKSKSVSTNKEIKVLFIRDGSLEDWENKEHFSWHKEIKKDGGADNRENETQYEIEDIKKFQLFDLPIQQKDVSIAASFLPVIQDTVLSDKYGKLTLTNEIGSGGEGKIYLTHNGLVCKIYLKEKATSLKLNKLKLMLNNPIIYDGICWPKDLIYNSKNEFVGYLMEKALGKPMQTSMFVKPVLQKNFPNWTRKDLVLLSINILEKIHYLHQRNVIIGDINPLNILIDNEQNIIKAYFVDTDSYQIENYPCPVGTVTYTLPEIQGKDYKTFLRTFEHENFAVATLLFMILLPGKPPYSQQGGSDPAHNIKSMDFSYPIGDKSNKKAPLGPWRFIWSNLPYNVKEAFYGVFTNNQRKLTNKWLDLMDGYIYSLEQKYVSDELFPTKYKLVNPMEVKCSRCGEDFSVNKKWIEQLKSQGKDYICETCRENKHPIIAGGKEERANICLGIILNKIIPLLVEKKIIQHVAKQLDRDLIIKIVFDNKNLTKKELAKLISIFSSLGENDIENAIEMGLNNGKIKFLH